MASRAEYVHMAKLIGELLMPLGVGGVDDTENESKRINTNRVRVLEFAAQLAMWYSKDNSRFSSELFYKAINDYAVDVMEGFKQWGATAEGLSHMERLLDSEEELPD